MLSPGMVSNTDGRWDDVVPAELFDFDRILAVVRRQWLTVACGALICFALGLVYVFTAVPQYTAAASVLIDKDNNNVATQLSSLATTGFADDEASILSQVELIKSDTIASAVVDNLKLADNAIFMASASSPTAFVAKLLNFTTWFADSDTVQSDEKKREIAIALLHNNMGVDRVGRTYVLSIAFTSTSPQLAAQVAKSISEEYLVDKLNSKYEATRRASDWLQQRIEELRQKALDSDLAVQKFRAQNGLVSSNGQLLSDQQLSQLNAALVDAQGQVAQSQAKYDRIESI
jgi:succinoglycan biosynthesis transport protein ExoP